MKACLDIQAALGQRAGEGDMCVNYCGICRRNGSMWMPYAGGLRNKIYGSMIMKYSRLSDVCICILLYMSGGLVSVAASLQDYENKVLTLYMSDMTYVYKGYETLHFKNLPTLCVFKYTRPTGVYGDEYLIEFTRMGKDGSYDVLLSPDLNPKGVPPTLWSIDSIEDGSNAVLTLLFKVQGNGGLWVKDTYQYDGVSISKTDSVSGIGDPYHKDPISGKYVPTPPSWWGPPVRTKWDRYQKDPETGATWMLVPDETKDADTTSGEEKARRYRQDPETGYWWKRVD